MIRMLKWSLLYLELRYSPQTVNIATVSADAVNAYVVEDTIEAANAINRDYLTKLEAKAEAATTVYSADEVYKSILDLRAEFIKANTGRNRPYE